MSVKEVYDYVMHTPKNTNPAVLSSMLRHLSWNDLKDKPFYTEMVEEVVVERHTLNFSGKYWMIVLDNEISSWDNVEVHVFWDGVTYDCTVFGNGTVSQINDEFQDPNIPFYITFEPYQIIFSKESADDESIEFGITRTVEKAHPIEPKYLPCDLMFKVGCTGVAHPKSSPQI